jgi:hypothetical protein
MMKRWYILLLPACLVLISCNKRNEALEKRISQLESKLDSISAQRQASATEVFHLRSECADLGVKILNDNLVGMALTKSQVSHYNPKTNRCYVVLTIQSANLSAPSQRFEEYLYDGQTGEQLAFAKKDKDVEIGMVFKNRMVFKGRITGYGETLSYIDDIMRDE